MTSKYKYPYKLRKRNSVATKELMEKHKSGVTLAPLDICLRKELITKEMHQAANYFIYLYSLRFGRSSLKNQVSSIYNFDRFSVYSTNGAFEEEKTMIYKDIVLLLKSLNSYELVLDICVYGKFPAFLTTLKGDINSYDGYMKFREAMEELLIFFRAKL